MNVQPKGRRWLPTVVVVALGVCSALVYAYVSGAHPKLAIFPVQCDFETFSAEQRAERTVRLRNDGRKELKIISVQASCGCTTAQLASPQIPPGRDTTLKIEVDGRGRSGEINESVTIESNDPTRPLARIRVVGTVDPGYTINPRVADFGGVPLEHLPVEQSILVESPMDHPFPESARVVTEPSFVTGRLERLRDPERYQVVLGLSPNTPGGPIEGAAWLEIPDKNGGVAFRCHIPVSGRILTKVRLEPPIAYFQSLSSGQNATVQLEVVGASAQEAIGLEIVPHAATNFLTVALDDKMRISLTIASNAPAGRIEAHVAMRTGVSNAVVFAPIYAYVQPAASATKGTTTGP